MSGARIKGHLDSLLLAIVEQGALHGYAVIEELRRLSDGQLDLPEGTVYPALHRLERAGLLRSAWDDNSIRRRRVYELSAAGRKALGRERQEWQGFATAINAIMGVGNA